MPWRDPLRRVRWYVDAMNSGRNRMRPSMERPAPPGPMFPGTRWNVSLLQTMDLHSRHDRESRGVGRGKADSRFRGNDDGCEPLGVIWTFFGFV